MVLILLFFYIFLGFSMLLMYLYGMMMIKSRAIVLRTVKYGDSRFIVDMFTEEQGRVSFAVSVSRSPRSRMKKSFFMPLTLVEVNYDFRMKSDLQKLRDVRISQPLSSLSMHPYKLSIGLFISEFLLYATRDERENPPLFNFIAYSLEWLDGVTNGFSNFHLVFMIRLTRFIGFSPNIDSAVEGSYFDLLNACFSSEMPLHGHFLAPFEASKIALLMRLNYQTMHLCAMSRDERNRCTEVILEYYRLHVPGFPILKSLDVLKELFS